MNLKLLIISSSLLFFYLLGIWKLIYFIVSVVAFFVGFGLFDSVGKPYFLKPYKCQLPKGLSKVIDGMKVEETVALDTKISGNKALDKAFIELVDLLIRDYLESWYQYISPDQKFTQEIKRSIYSMLSNLSERCKPVDWVTVLTEDLPNEIGSHIKLYRLSNQYCSRGKDRNLHHEFFNLESQFYKYFCTENICTKPEAEKKYLRELSEFFLYLVCPSHEFNVPPVRYLLRETLVNSLVIPTLDLMADPDFINQYIVWMCKENSYTSEYFIQSIRMSHMKLEIKAVIEQIEMFNQCLRSRDSGGDDDAIIKAQLGSLDYLKKICSSQLGSLETPKSKDDNVACLRSLTSEKVQSINLEFILCRQIGISLFLEFLSTINATQYLNCYISLFEYRSMFSGSIDSPINNKQEELEEEDNDIFQEHKSSPSHIQHSPSSTTNLNPVSVDQMNFSKKILNDCKELNGLDVQNLSRIENCINYEKLDTDMFDSVFNEIFYILRTSYLESFKESKFFFQFLDEIDYFRDESQISEEELVGENVNSKSDLSCSGSFEKLEQDNYNVRIVDASIQNHNFVQYTLVILKTDRYGAKKTWKTYRRYRDFDALHTFITEVSGKFPELKLPPKKAINNMNSEFMEKRGCDLQEYITAGFSLKVPEVRSILINFVKEGPWEVKSNMKMTQLMNPFKNIIGSAVQSIKPDNLSKKFYSSINSNSKVSPLSPKKTFFIHNPLSLPPHNTSSNVTGRPQTLPVTSNSVLSSSANDQTDNIYKFNDNDQNKADNIPIRIMLLLVDEIFDLQNKSQMVRRGLLGILRRIVKTFFGEKVNKIILDKAGLLASGEQLAELLNKLKESLWPSVNGGKRAEPAPARDEMTKMRTRVLCRAKMLGSISDEVSQFLGNETTRQGVQRVFELFQDKTLNRRFLHSLLYLIMLRVFPDSNLDRLLDYCLCPATIVNGTDHQRVCERHGCQAPLSNQNWKDWMTPPTPVKKPL